jgi:trans-2,3-dihydro-3-hydroxyanthranilate isomerase
MRRERIIMRYFIADVFCREKYSGNQLAVVFSPGALPEKEMQRIANEFHFSETSFVFTNGKKDDAYPVRIFTPRNEVPFAGHPTLGTAYIIRNELEKAHAGHVNLDLKVGTIPVSFDDAAGLQWMKQIEPTFGAKHDPGRIAEILNLSVGDIDTRFPLQQVSTGIDFLIIPLNGLASVKKASTNLANYNTYFDEATARDLFIFCPETYEKANSINCRMFADIFGIPEDPATGSANGCLAAYLSKYKYFGSENVDLSVEQGYEIGRRSILRIKAHRENGRYNIEVGGKVIKVAEGTLL